MLSTCVWQNFCSFFLFVFYFYRLGNRFVRWQHLREYIDLVKIAINMKVAFDICFPSFRSAIREFELKKDRFVRFMWEIFFILFSQSVWLFGVSFYYYFLFVVLFCILQCKTRDYRLNKSHVLFVCLVYVNRDILSF